MRIWNAIWQAIDRAYWWVMHRTLNRYDLIRLRSLPPGYHDKDVMYLHACFQLLVNFVEREKGLEWWGDPGEGQDEQSIARRDLARLYYWWTAERPARDTQRDGMWADKSLDSSMVMKLEDTHEAEDQRNLERLTQLRGYLWT